jgi:predicted lipoprotein
MGVNKYIKYGLLIAVIGLLGYKSLYFEKLSTRKNTVAAAFDVPVFSKKLWEEKMPVKIDSAIDLSVLIATINKDGEAAINKYTNALAIGNYRYALVKLNATVADVKEDEVVLSVPNDDSTLTVNLATEFIYGNAVRDASGVVAVKDFPNTADLNGISEELNKIIRATVLPSFKATVKKGDKINAVAAMELNKAHIHWQGIELLPLRLQILQ